MIYNKAKRRISVLSAIIGLFLSIFAFVLPLLELIAKDKVLDALGIYKDACGFSAFLGKYLPINFTSSNILIFLIAFILIALLTFFVSVKLLKKPVKVDEKYKKYGLLKFLFIIFVIISGLAIATSTPIACYGIKDKQVLENAKCLISMIVLIVAVIVALLQLISCFFSQTQEVAETEEEERKRLIKEELAKAKKEAKANKKADKNGNEDAEANAIKQGVEDQSSNVEVPVIDNAPAQEEVSIYSVLFDSLSNDPVADGFKQRIREVKHLKEIGLLDDEQVSTAVDNIIKNFMK